MEEKNTWIQTGSNFSLVTGGEILSNQPLPQGIYTVQYSPNMGFFLDKIANKFVLPKKLYCLDHGFIDRIITAYENLNKNIGALFNGLRGTGKSVSSKQICNKLELPTIAVKSFGQMNDQMFEFLSKFKFRCIFLFDEFEKEFGEDPSVLTFLDGIHNSEYPKLFLLTTNSTRINENLLDRPGRIRYMRNYENIDPEIIREFLKDNLTDASRINELVEFIQKMSMCTIDILTMLSEEINLFGYDKVLENSEMLNISTQNFEYRIKYLDYINDHSYKDLFIAENAADEDVANVAKLVEDILNRSADNAYHKVLCEGTEDEHTEWYSFSSIRVELNKNLESVQAGDIIDDVSSTIFYSSKVIKTIPSLNLIYIKQTRNNYDNYMWVKIDYKIDSSLYKRTIL